MRSILRCFPNRFFANLALAGLIAGLVMSKVVLSVATITIMCNAFVNIHAAENFKRWLSDRTSLLLLSVFGIYLLSGFYSDDISYWVDRCRMKLPFIALPLGFAALQPLTKKRFQQWLAFYCIVITGTSVVVCINYLLHYEAFNERLSLGQPIPAPMNDHIRFSLEVAFAIIVGGYLSTQQFFVRRWQKIIEASALVFLFIFIHVLAVRTGIAGLYLTGIVLLFRWAFIRKQYFKALLATMVAAIVIYVSFLFIPSLQNRMNYFIYEFDLIRKGELHPEHSDAQRLLSMMYGWQIAKDNLLLGTGAGDIKNEMEALYNKNNGEGTVKSKLPHNQFIYVFAATGLAGFLIFSGALFYPLFTKQRYRDVLFLSFFCIIVFSFLAEHTLEIQIGTAFYLLFLLMIKKVIDDRQIALNM
jgi:O-antigen ligase